MPLETCLPCREKVRSGSRSAPSLSSRLISYNDTMITPQIDAFREAVRLLGGEVRGVSRLNDWMHIRLPESLAGVPVVDQVESCAFLDETLARLATKLSHNEVSDEKMAYDNVMVRDVVAYLVLGSMVRERDCLVSDCRSHRLTRYPNIFEHITQRNIAAAVKTAGLEQLVSLVDLVVKPARQERSNQGRPDRAKLLHAGSHKRNLLQSPSENSGAIYLPLMGPTYPDKWLTMNTYAEAANLLQVWATQKSFLLRCKDNETGSVYYAGDSEATPVCLLEYEYELTPVDDPASSMALRFDGTDALFKSRCDQVPSEYCESLRGIDPSVVNASLVNNDTFIFTMTFNLTAEVGVEYESPLNKLKFAFISGEKSKAENVPQTHTFTDGQNETELPGDSPVILNRFNGNGPTLRELAGVSPELLGNKDMVMSTTLEIAAGSAAVNLSVSNEYLGWFGYNDFTPLVIDDSLGVKNNVSKLCPWPNAGPGGFPEPNGDCGEAELDVLSMQSIAPKATSVFYPTERSPGFPTDFLQGWMKWWDAWDAQETIPDILSLSWSDDFSVMGPYYRELEERLKKTVAAGLSVLVSSGDGGASGLHGDGCYPAENPLIANWANETWPTASPWVTVVGGTMMRPIDGKLKETVASTENGCGAITSGGGFVGTWFNETTPAWQKKQVERYLAENNVSTFPGFPTDETPGYNPTGRAFPDIAAYGDAFPTCSKPMLGVESLASEAGTSLSAPVVAGLFSLANGKLVEAGYSKIGYANPMLYWMGENCKEAFNDITDGNNQWAGKNTKCLYGFPAAPGWDPATGLGTIRFEPFVECAKRYQDEVRNKGLELLPDGSYGSLSNAPSPPSTPSNPILPEVSASIPGPMSALALLFTILCVTGT